MKRIVLMSLLLLAFGLCSAFGAAAGEAYSAQIFSYDTSYGLLSTMVKHPLLGLYTQGDYEVASGATAGVVFGERADDARAIVGGSLHQLDFEQQTTTAQTLSGLNGLKPVGMPCGFSLRDGRMIVALAPMDSSAEPDPATRIAELEPGSASLRTLIDGAWKPALSPDGTSIAYEKLGDNPGVYVAPLSGGPAGKVGAYSSLWGWTVGNQLIVSLQEKEKVGWYLVNPDGTGAKEILMLLQEAELIPTWPVVSPSGDEVMFMFDECLYSSSIDGSDPFQFYIVPDERPLIGYRWVTIE